MNSDIMNQAKFKHKYRSVRVQISDDTCVFRKLLFLQATYTDTCKNCKGLKLFALLCSPKLHICNHLKGRQMKKPSLANVNFNDKDVIEVCSRNIFPVWERFHSINFIVDNCRQSIDMSFSEYVENFIVEWNQGESCECQRHLTNNAL